jgi:16S rRNA (guanine527-N7)-methyltransferase
MSINQLKEWMLTKQISCPNNFYDRISLFKDLLYNWNKAHNLTRVPESEFYIKHVLDSLIPLSLNVKFYNIRLASDIGTGAGFPGLPLAMCLPNCQWTLVDSLEKRIAFIDMVISKLGLSNVKAVHSRIEDYCNKHRNEYELITVRALASLSEIINWSSKALKNDGMICAYKGKDITLELKDIEESGFQINVKEYILPNVTEKNHLVEILN